MSVRLILHVGAGDDFGAEKGEVEARLWESETENSASGTSCDSLAGFERYHLQNCARA